MAVGFLVADARAFNEGGDLRFPSLPIMRSSFPERWCRTCHTTLCSFPATTVSGVHDSRPLAAGQVSLDMPIARRSEQPHATPQYGPASTVDQCIDNNARRQARERLFLAPSTRISASRNDNIPSSCPVNTIFYQPRRHAHPIASKWIYRSISIPSDTKLHQQRVVVQYCFLVMAKRRRRVYAKFLSKTVPELTEDIERVDLPS